MKERARILDINWSTDLLSAVPTNWAGTNRFSDLSESTRGGLLKIKAGHVKSPLRFSFGEPQSRFNTYLKDATKVSPDVREDCSLAQMVQLNRKRQRELIQKHLRLQRQAKLQKAEIEAALPQVLDRLNRQATQNREFGSESEALKVSIEENRVTAEELLNRAGQSKYHGRVRWLLAEAVADHHPGAEIQTFLLDQLRSEADAWMLYGAATLLRGLRLSEPNRTEALRILRNRLGEALENEKPYRESVKAQALGDMLLLTGSLAEKADIPLLGRFPLADWDIKPRANAFEALKHVLRRHPESQEAREFFEKHLDQLDKLGCFLAESRSLGPTHGVLLQSLIGLLTARLERETEVALNLAERFSYAIRPTKRAILDSKKAFSRMHADEWLRAREEWVIGWLERLECALAKKRNR